MSVLLTGSVKSTTTCLSPVIRAENCGAMPSDTVTDETATKALPARSDTSPEPESASDPTSSPDVSYLRYTPSGAPSARFPSRVSTTVSEPSVAVLRSTERPAASVPDTDQPCACVSERASGSLNETDIASRATASADDIFGARPSDTCTDPDISKCSLRTSPFVPS